VYPKGKSDEWKDYLSVYVYLIWCQEDKIRARYKFSIMNARQEETKSRGECQFSAPMRLQPYGCLNIYGLVHTYGYGCYCRGILINVHIVSV